MDFSMFLHFDQAVYQWVEKVFDYGISGLITPVLVFLTKISDNGLIWIVLAVLLLIFKKTRKIGFTMLASIACMIVFSDLIMKGIFARPRPFELEVWKSWFVYPEFVTRPDSYSFPSGHATSAFAAATALTFTSKKVYAAVPAFILAILIAFSRIYVHVHYPTDVLFGALFGILYGVIAIVVCKYIFKFVNEKTKLTVFKD